MIGVLAAAITELRELETAGGRLLILRRCVVALLALATLQCHDFTHLIILIDSQHFCEIFKLLPEVYNEFSAEDLGAC